MKNIQNNNPKDEPKVIGGPVNSRSSWLRKHKKAIIAGLGIVLLIVAAATFYVMYIEQKSFNSRPVTLSYPKDWKVVRTSTPDSYKGSTFIALTSPVDSTLQTEPVGKGDNQLESALIVSPYKKSNRMLTVKVLAVKDFTFQSGTKKAKLLALDTNADGKADFVLLGSPESKVGDKTVSGYFVYNDKYQLSLQSSIANSSSRAAQEVSAPEAKDAQALLDSNSVASLTKIIAGIRLE